MTQSNNKLDPYNRGGMWAFLFSIAFSVVFFIWVSFFQGINLNEIPDEVKAAMAADKAKENSASINASASSGATIDNNAPVWTFSEAMVLKGKVAYKANCAICHGDAGKGDGPAGMAIGARNLVEGKWKSSGDTLGLFKTITNGLLGTSMVGFPQISIDDRWAIAHFIRSITTNKPKDDLKALESFAASAK
jgi:mono/diheme cytochrome c family protein